MSCPAAWVVLRSPPVGRVNECREEWLGYRNATIHFMSGTGNSFRAATWMTEAARRSGAEAHLVPIGKDRPDGGVEQGEGGLVGLVFPTHAFTAPWPVLRQAWRLPRGGGTHAFVVPTRAGTKFGSLFLPGLEGTAGYLVAFILAVKGYSVRGVMGIDMPSNFMIAHPGFSPAAARAIIARGESKARAFAGAVLGGRRRYAGFIPLVLGLVLLPVSLAYVLLGRFYLAKMMFANATCTGCGACAAHCPFGAIRMWGKTRKRPYWTFACETCLRCMAWCPEGAVESGHSLGVILCLVTTIPVSVYAMDWVTARLPLPVWVKGGVTLVLLQYAYIILSIFLTYLVFSLLIRIPLVNRLFTYTTLVHYYRRYHEPDTTSEDLDAER